MTDLFVLVADKNMEFLLKGLLPRIPSIENTREFSFEIMRYILNDPGVYKNAHTFLKQYTNLYKFCMVVLDYEGCGNIKKSSIEIEEEIESNLSRNGWDKRNCAIAINPELEQWVWVNEIHIKNAISWENDVSIYKFLEDNNLKEKNSTKPKRPKETFEKILKDSKVPRSSSIYEKIAKNASYKNCTDKAFLKLLNFIRTSFPKN